MGPCPVYAQDFVLPAPGQMVALSPAFSPAVLKGIKLDPQNPFRFHFFVDTGDSPSLVQRGGQGELRQESTRLIKYFLASLTIPEKDLWVNLSPYEKDRIVPQEFGQTEMGRDLLAEDYLLKQITASLIYPESKLGKEFWQKVYDKAQAKYGTTNIPINTFNKVWIVPDKAVVYENGGTAFVLENHLKVMLEQDYLSLQKHSPSFVKEGVRGSSDIGALGSQIVREIVIPALTREVNEGKNFAQLRQVFYSLILATWYKKKIKDSILNKIYADKNKIAGVGYKNSPPLVGGARGGGTNDIEAIYQQYLKAFKKGVYNYIKEDPTPDGQVVPKKYFSGGVNAQLIDVNLAMIGPKQISPAQISALASAQLVDVDGNMAMINQLPGLSVNGVMKVEEPRVMLSKSGIMDPILVDTSRMATEHLSYLDRHMEQWKFIGEKVMDMIIACALKEAGDPQSPDIRIVVGGASYGEEIARAFAETVWALKDRGYHVATTLHGPGWRIWVYGIEHSEHFAHEARLRFQGESAFYYKENQPYARRVAETLRQFDANLLEKRIVINPMGIDDITHLDSFDLGFSPHMFLMNKVLYLLKMNQGVNIHEYINRIDAHWPDCWFIDNSPEYSYDKRQGQFNSMELEHHIYKYEGKAGWVGYPKRIDNRLVMRGSGGEREASGVTTKAQVADGAMKTDNEIIERVSNPERNWYLSHHVRNTVNDLVSSLFFLESEGVKIDEQIKSTVDTIYDSTREFLGSFDQFDSKLEYENAEINSAIKIIEKLKKTLGVLRGTKSQLVDLKKQHSLDKDVIEKILSNLNRVIELLENWLGDFDSGEFTASPEADAAMKVEEQAGEKGAGDQFRKLVYQALGNKYSNAEKWFTPYLEAGLDEGQIKDIIHRALHSPDVSWDEGFPLLGEQKRAIAKGIGRVANRGATQLSITCIGAGRSLIEARQALETALDTLEKFPNKVSTITIRFYDSHLSVLQTMKQVLSDRLLHPIFKQKVRKWKGKIKIEMFYADIREIQDPTLLQKIIRPSNIIILRNTWILAPDMYRTILKPNEYQTLLNIFRASIPEGALIVQEDSPYIPMSLRVFNEQIGDNARLGTADGAMNVIQKGGIDLNPAQMSVQVKKEGEDFKFDFNGTEIDAAQVTGATFTIRQMTPVKDLPQVLGLN